jgi:hypothetical protein
MNKLLPNKNKHRDANTDDVLALTIAKAKREKDEIRKQFEKRIKNLEIEVIGARLVMQSMVLVARISPDEFFGLLSSPEASGWSLMELKHIAAAIHNQLLLIKKSEATEGKEQAVSTAQRLYGYLLGDANADKKAVLQVISDLHKELSSAEDKFVPNEIQVDHDAPYVVEDDSCIKDSTTTAISTFGTPQAEEKLGAITSSSNGEESGDNDFEVFESVWEGDSEEEKILTL